MATRTIQANVAIALDKIGKTNGTAAPEITAPEGSTNKEAEAFHNDRQAAFEYMIAAQIKSYAEKREDVAKEKLRVLFKDSISSTIPGANSTVIRGDMSLQMEKRKGREMLDGALLMSALAKRGYDLNVCEAIIKEATKTTNPALYLRPSIITKE